MVKVLVNLSWKARKDQCPVRDNRAERIIFLDFYSVQAFSDSVRPTHIGKGNLLFSADKFKC